MPIEKGLEHNQKLLFAMDTDSEWEDLQATLNLKVAQNFNNLMSAYIEQGEVRILDMVHKSQQQNKADM